MPTGTHHCRNGVYHPRTLMLGTKMSYSSMKTKTCSPSSVAMIANRELAASIMSLAGIVT
jgi:hypothetical protein